LPTVDRQSSTGRGCGRPDAEEQGVEPRFWALSESLVAQAEPCSSALCGLLGNLEPADRLLIRYGSKAPVVFASLARHKHIRRASCDATGGAERPADDCANGTTRGSAPRGTGRLPGDGARHWIRISRRVDRLADSVTVRVSRCTWVPRHSRARDARCQNRSDRKNLVRGRHLNSAKHSKRANSAVIGSERLRSAWVPLVPAPVWI
jgi:hypothetical protein